MIRYYERRSLGEDFQHVTRLRGGQAWIHGDTVSQEELNELATEYGLLPNVLRDVRDVSELPRVEYDGAAGGATYLFLRVPRRTKHGEVYASPLLSIVQKDRFFTLGYGDIFQPEQIMRRIERHEEATPTLLVLWTFAAVVSEYEQLAHRTSRAVRDIGYRLKTHEVANKDFLRFVTIEDNLNEYMTNLDGMKAIALHMRDDRRTLFSAKEQEMLDDIILHIQQLLVSVGSQHQSIESIRNAYSTIANNTLNQRMKTLTVLTVLIALPNVFYGMYGMNVTLPFADQPWAYGVIVVFTIIIIFCVYLLARKLKIF